MNLQTNYLGLELKNPLIAGASPLSGDLSKVRALEDAGMSAITMYSLFEEQITQNMIGANAHTDAYEHSFIEAASYFPEIDLLDRGVDAYLEQLQKVKEAVDIPVIGSLNGNRVGEWMRYASLMESSGADALELNLYCLATRFDESAEDIEARYIRIISAIRKRISIPLIVKLSTSFTALPHFSKRLSESGVDALVLFNRFYQPDINIDTLEIEPNLKLSYSQELLMRLRWLALLSGRVDCQLSVSGGVHTGVDAVKALMAGADTIQLVSTLLINGPERVAEILKELRNWMAEAGYTDLDQLRGCMNYRNCLDPEAFERANYMRILKS
ncbi:MAG: dihydroorotate dehydrogenase-like protein [Opitutaceae bacterium]